MRGTTRQYRQALATLAGVTRWNRVRARQGRPLLDVPVLTLSDTRGARSMRLRRSLGRRMAEYDGVPYDDRMASSPRVLAAYLDAVAGTDLDPTRAEPDA